jgi:hypothetical protein
MPNITQSKIGKKNGADFCFIDAKSDSQRNPRNKNNMSVILISMILPYGKVPKGKRGENDTAAAIRMRKKDSENCIFIYLEKIFSILQEAAVSPTKAQKSSFGNTVLKASCTKAAAPRPRRAHNAAALTTLLTKRTLFLFTETASKPIFTNSQIKINKPKMPVSIKTFK